MKVSIVATVKNEGAVIQPLLDSLLYQTRKPDEIIFSDGGSTDNTIAIIEAYATQLPIRIVPAPGTNISQGRNRAIAVAAGPIIAVTDAGVVLSPHWLELLARPIEEEGNPVVSGWFEADPFTDFEVVMGATVLPELSEIDQETFLPSSRSIAFLKEAWLDVGGYPEWLDYGEDLIFDLALRKRYGPFPFVPGAVVYFRPRANLRRFARQYFLYSRGDGKANLWPTRHAVRYGTYLVALPAILRLIWRGKLAGWLLLLLGGATYCRLPAIRLWPVTSGWPPLQRLRAFAIIPVIRFVGDIAKMFGYPLGQLWRLGRLFNRR